MDRLESIDDFYRQLHAAKPAAKSAAKPATERGSPPPGLRAILAGLPLDTPEHLIDNLTANRPPAGGAEQLKSRFRRMHCMPANHVGYDERDHKITYRAEDGPMGFGFYKPSGHKHGVVNFYPATGVGQLLQGRQQPSSSHHDRQSRRHDHEGHSRGPPRAALIMPPHGIPPPPDMRGPEWQAYFASLPPPEPSYPDCVYFSEFLNQKPPLPAVD